MLGVCEIPTLRLLPRMAYTVWSTQRADSILLYGPHRQRTVFCSILLYRPHRQRTVFCYILLYDPHRERTVFCSMVHTESGQYFALWSTLREDNILLCGPHIDRTVFCSMVHIVQELCESRGGRPGVSVLTSLLVSVDVKLY